MSTTPTQIPTKVVINVSAQLASRLFDEANQWAAKTAAAETAGDLQAASGYTVNAQMARKTAQDILVAEGLPADIEATQVVPLTTDELTQRQTDQDATMAAEAAALKQLAAVNQATLLAKRNRWLFESDPYLLAGTGVTDLPADVASTVQANLAVIQTWRQQLRDWPDTVTDWTTPPDLPAIPPINLASGKPLFRLT